MYNACMAAIRPKRKRKPFGARKAVRQHERDVAWAKENVPEVYERLGILVIGNVEMAREAGSLTPETVRARAHRQYGEWLQDLPGDRTEPIAVAR